MSLSRFLSVRTVRTAIERLSLAIPTSNSPVQSPDRRNTPNEQPTGTGLDQKLLSDREVVLRALDVDDGRAWQADVVTRTGWSEAKVSRILSEMEASDEIVRFRDGRRKVVCSTKSIPESMSPLTKQQALANLKGTDGQAVDEVA